MLTSRAVMLRIIDALPGACIVSTCGFITRELYNAADRENNFYLVGSMGMAGPIAYGIATARPGQQVIAIDGDGSIAMNLGGLTLARYADVPVVHLVLDNGMHESTGGQQVATPVDLPAIAAAAGYHSTLTLGSEADLAALDRLAEASHPVFVHASVAPRGGSAGHRVRQTPQELVVRTANFLNPAVPVLQKGIVG